MNELDNGIEYMNNVNSINDKSSFEHKINEMKNDIEKIKYGRNHTNKNGVK